MNVTYYRINSGNWIEYSEPFTLSEDGDDILIEYYSIDNVGNREYVKSVKIDIDQTEPDIALCHEIVGGNRWQGWDFIFTAIASDDISGMERVEFYLYTDLKMSTVYGAGPEYTWTVTVPSFLPNTFNVYGLINKLEINDDYVKFNALIVRISKAYLYPGSTYPKACGFDKAGNWDCDEIIPFNSISIKSGIYLFQSIVLPNNYIGYIGNNFISAKFNIN